MAKTPKIVPISLVLLTILIAMGVVGWSGCSAPTQNNGSNMPPTNTATPPPGLVAKDCNSDSAGVVVKAIYDEIENQKLGKHLWQFNMHIDAQKRVWIRGWSSRKNDIEQIVRSVARNCTIENLEFTTDRATVPDPGNNLVTHSCTGNRVACGDVCVDPGQCASSTTFVPPGNANANSNTNSNTNSDTNSNSGKKP